MPRRTNHGESRLAGDLAQHAVATIVPRERLRITRLQIAWDELVGPRLRQVAWPGALRGKQLIVYVLNPQWQHELVYMQDELISRINERCPECPVGSIRLRVGDIPPLPPEPPPPPPPDIIDLPDEPAPDTVAALSDIGDTSLRKLMANARMALSGRLRKP